MEPRSWAREVGWGHLVVAMIYLTIIVALVLSADAAPGPQTASGDRSNLPAR